MLSIASQIGMSLSRAAFTKECQLITWKNNSESVNFFFDFISVAFSIERNN